MTTTTPTQTPEHQVAQIYPALSPAPQTQNLRAEYPTTMSQESNTPVQESLGNFEDAPTSVENTIIVKHGLEWFVRIVENSEEPAVLPPTNFEEIYNGEKSNPSLEVLPVRNTTRKQTCLAVDEPLTSGDNRIHMIINFPQAETTFVVVSIRMYTTNGDKLFTPTLKEKNLKDNCTNLQTLFGDEDACFLVGTPGETRKVFFDMRSESMHGPWKLSAKIQNIRQYFVMDAFVPNEMMELQHLPQSTVKSENFFILSKRQPRFIEGHSTRKKRNRTDPRIVQHIAQMQQLTNQIENLQKEINKGKARTIVLRNLRNTFKAIKQLNASRMTREVMLGWLTTAMDSINAIEMEDDDTLSL